MKPRHQLARSGKTRKLCQLKGVFPPVRVDPSLEALAVIGILLIVAMQEPAELRSS